MKVIYDEFIIRIINLFLLNKNDGSIIYFIQNKEKLLSKNLANFIIYLFIQYNLIDKYVLI